MVRAADGGTSAAASDRTGQTRSSGCPPECEQGTGRKPGPTCTVHRIGRAPAPGCQDCTMDLCKASWCPLRREQPNLPDHVLRRCPALMGAEKIRQHKPDAGGGPRDRAGGSHYQRRPEPTGYALSPLRVGGATTTAFNYRRAPSSPPCGSPPRSLVTQVGSTVRRAGGTGNRTRVLPTTEMVPYHLRHQSRKYR